MSIADSLSESFVILGLVARFLGLRRRGLDYLSLRVLGVAERNKNRVCVHPRRKNPAQRRPTSSPQPALILSNRIDNRLEPVRDKRTGVQEKGKLAKKTR